MSSYKTVVVGTDGSDSSLRAVDRAGALASGPDAKLVIATAYFPSTDDSRAADVLKDEGYVENFDLVDDGRQGLIRVKLRYGPGGEATIHNLQRLSKPGRRVYAGTEDLPRPMQGLGIAIVSTSAGVFSDRKARESRVGGELLCVVE